MEPESAHHLGYHTRGTINADHVQMTKFRSPYDPDFEAVCFIMRQWTRPPGGPGTSTASTLIGAETSTAQLDSSPAAAAELDGMTAP